MSRAAPTRLAQAVVGTACRVVFVPLSQPIPIGIDAALNSRRVPSALAYTGPGAMQALVDPAAGMPVDDLAGQTSCGTGAAKAGSCAVDPPARGTDNMAYGCNPIADQFVDTPGGMHLPRRGVVDGPAEG